MVLSRTMTALQQGITHAVLTGLAIVAATVLCAIGQLSATDAVAIILAAAGIGGTGVAAVTSSAKSAPAAPNPARAVSAGTGPAA